MAREKSNRINLYKIADGHDFASLEIDGSDGFEKEFEDTTMKLYIRKQKVGVPKWATYLKPLISSDVKKIINCSSSFILFVKYNKSVYALSGGYGYSKLGNYIEDDFGVQMALRMLRGISALNQRSLKGTTRQIYRAVLGYDPIFDKENFTRVLKSVAGKGDFEGKTFRIDGKSSLVLRTTKDISKLKEVLTEIENIASQPEKIHFPKSFVVEKDKSVINELDQEMLGMIQAYWNSTADRDRLYLEFDDVFLQFRCVNFKGKYESNDIKFDDFDLDIIKDLFLEKGFTTISSIDDLAKITFSGFNEDGYEEFNQSFMDLLVCEISKNGKSFIKIGKRWLKILDEFQKFIDKELRIVTVLHDLLPIWDKQQCPKEFDYNTLIASKKGWKCMDQDLIQLQKSKIEVCDVFDKVDKRFFHIKETWGSKSSYLFSQGITSAEFFYSSDDFRQKCKDKWPDQFDDDRVNYKIVFGIAADKAGEENFPLNMTFFAKLNLYNALVVLKQMDYGACLVPVKILKN